MNNERRKKIKTLCEELRLCLDLLDSIKEEEEESFDSMAENLQYSSKGDTLQENISTLEEAYDNIEDIINELINL